MKTILTAVILMIGTIAAAPQAPSPKTKPAGWREASESELKTIVPARAQVEKERIETELRTASGITNGHQSIFGVVLITAGYSAQGKYSHFFEAEAPIQASGLAIPAGEYVIGYRRNNDVLEVSFYEAATGKLIGTVQAKPDPQRRKVASIYIAPPTGESVIALGRFVIPYRMGE